MDAASAKLDLLDAECRLQLALLEERRQAELDNLLVRGVTDGAGKTVTLPWPVQVPAAATSRMVTVSSSTWPPLVTGSPAGGCTRRSRSPRASRKRIETRAP